MRTCAKCSGIILNKMQSTSKQALIDMLRFAVCLIMEDFIIGDVFVLRENEDTYNVGWHFN